MSGSHVSSNTPDRHPGESRDPFAFKRRTVLAKIKMDPGFRRDDGLGGQCAGIAPAISAVNCRARR
jgi:hypothetical protein